MCKAIEDLIAESEARGRAEGEVRGRAEGETRGEAKGIIEICLDMSFSFSMYNYTVLFPYISKYSPACCKSDKDDYKYTDRSIRRRGGDRDV